MKTENTKVRIKDIAVLAGVSEGTVDRVLHNRGEVSKKSKEAVEKVLKEINYSPNLLARSLASKKHYRFACFIPAYQPGEYWESGFYHLLWSKFLSKRISGCEIIAEFFAREFKNTDNYYQQKQR